MIALCNGLIIIALFREFNIERVGASQERASVSREIATHFASIRSVTAHLRQRTLYSNLERSSSICTRTFGL